MQQTPKATHSVAAREVNMACHKNTVDEIEPMAFINGAVGYQAAANELYWRRYEPANERVSLEPIYFLYFHALELAFKGYLRTQGKTTRELAENNFGHHLTSLYAACSVLVGSLDGETRDSLQNVISLLENSNRSMGLRYFTSKSRTFPELSWTRDLVQALVQTAKAAVLKLDPGTVGPGPGVKLDFVIGKPDPRIE